MAVLKWDNVSADLSGGGQGRGVGLIADSFDPLSEALARLDKKNRSNEAAAGIRQGLSIDDPELFIEGMRRGNFDITPENYEFFTNRVGQLLGEKKTRQDMSLAVSQEERAKQLAADERKSRGIIDANAITQGKVSDLALQKGLVEFDRAKEIMTLAPEGAKRAAAIRQEAAKGNVESAQGLLADPATQEMLIKAGWTVEGIDTFSKSLNQAADAARKEADAVYQHGLEVGARPETERIAALKRQGEKFNLETGLATAGRAEDLRERAVTKEDEQYAREQKALEAFNTLVAGEYGGSLASLHEGARNFPDLDPATRALLTAKIEEAAGGFAKLTPQQLIDEMRAADPNAASGPRMVSEGYTAPAGSIIGLIDQKEGGGKYNTLFANAQDDPNSPFAGVDVSQMTIGQLNQMANSGGYKAWVAGKNGGTAASPMGRYQIVNDTLQSAAARLGLSPDTVFNKETQDKLFTFLINQRLGNRGGGIEGQMEGLRNEWEGLRNVDDATLRAAIQNFQQGDPGFGTSTNAQFAGGTLSGLQAAIEGGPRQDDGSGRMIPIDETSGKAAVAFTEDLLKQKGPMTAQQLSTLNDQEILLQKNAAMVSDALTFTDAFKGQTPALLAAMQNPANATKSFTDVKNELAAKYGDIKADQITDEMNLIIDKYHVNPGVAAAFIEAAPRETYWINPFSDNESIDHDKIDRLFGNFYKLDVKDPVERNRGALEHMQTIRERTSSADNLKQYQIELRDAMTEAANISAKKRTNPNVDDKRAIRRVKNIQEKVNKELDRLDEMATQALQEQATIIGGGAASTGTAPVTADDIFSPPAITDPSTKRRVGRFGASF